LKNPTDDTPVGFFVKGVEMPQERIYSAQKIVEALGQFGIEPKEAVALLHAQDMPALQRRLKEEWHKLAFRLHPDRGGDEAAFKRLSALYDALEKLRPVRVAAPQPMDFGVVVVVGFDGATIYHRPIWGSSSTTTGVW
jgi:hypothetical protein